VVVKGEVTADFVSIILIWSKRSRHSRRDDIDTSVLHGVPSLLSDSLGGLVELLLGSLTVPVGLDDLQAVSMIVHSDTFLASPDTTCLGR
jgi:hypothetical protein